MNVKLYFANLNIKNSTDIKNVNEANKPGIESLNTSIVTNMKVIALAI